MIGNRSIFEEVSALALDAGFDAGGIADVPEPGSPEDYEELRHFAPWIDAGRAGEMEYLKRRGDEGQLLRSSLRVALPWARSVIVCAVNYNSAAPRSIDSAGPDERLDCAVRVDRAAGLTA
jgi:epoxyqueuosine reductase